MEQSHGHANTIITLLGETLIMEDSVLEDMRKNIELERNIMGQYGIDSLDMVEFMLRIEDHFGISIPESDAAITNSVAKIDKYLASRGITA